MKIPDLTTDEIESIVIGANVIAWDTDANPDHVIANVSFRIGVDTARDDILELLGLMSNNTDMKHIGAWQESIEELRDYMLTNLTPKEWYDDSE